MNSKRILAAAAVLLIAATACSPEAEKQKAAAPKGASAATSASVMQHGKGEGTITAIDPAKNMVTLDHGEIAALQWRSEEHTSELQSLMRISYAVFCLKTK